MSEKDEYKEHYIQNRISKKIANSEPDWIQSSNYDRRILFLLSHIPKSGGTTIRKHLAKQYGRYFVTHHPDAIDIGEQVVSGAINPNEILAMSSHEPYGYHKNIVAIDQRKVLPITLVRSPLKRMLSLYNFITTFQKHPFYKDTAGMEVNEFFDYLYSEKLFSRSGLNFTNRQCQIVSGGDFDFDATRSILEDEYFAYGILEHINPLIQIVGETLGWLTDNSDLPIVNKSPNLAIEEDLSVATKEMLKYENAQDMLLYEYVSAKGLTINKALLS